MTRALLLVLMASSASAWAQGLTGTYFAGNRACPNLPTDVRLSRLDASLNFDNRTGASANWNLGTIGTAFTARWSGTFNAVANGVYRFQFEHDDEVSFIVDGTSHLALTGTRALSTRTVDVPLAPGSHVIEVCYANVSGTARMRLQYQEPGGTTFGPIPTSRLTADPAFGSGATTANFDGIAAGTYLTNQVPGVQWPNQLGASGFYYSKPRVVAPTASTSSPPRVVRNESWDAIEATEISAGVPLTLKFTSLQSHIALDTGVDVQIFPNNPPAKLRAYNAAGEVVAAHVVDPVTTNITSRLHVLRGGADISTITIDFGDMARDERIDGLRFEAFTVAPTPPDLTAPLVTFLEPAAGPLSSPSLTVVVKVTDASGDIPTVSASVNGTTHSMEFDGGEVGCTPPTCQRFRTSFSVPNGSHRITVTATDGAGNTSSATRDITYTGATEIAVVDDAGNPAPAAELFINGRLHPVPLDSSGRVRITPPLPAGTELVARERRHEQNFYKGTHGHGSTQDWNYRVYRTSVTVNDDGSRPVHSISNTAAVQTLTLRDSNVLFGLHWTLAANWNFGGELESLQTEITQASRFLYNATDGQFFIEQVEIWDHGENWGDADGRIFANQSMRAFVNWPRGGFLGNNLFATSYMHMPRTGPGWTWAHEFGHYGLDLGDEYADGDSGRVCTAATSGTVPELAVGGSKASCMMWNQGAAQKLCSHIGENPHLDGTRQGATSCWAHIQNRWGAGGTRQIKTPETRNAIPDRLAFPVPDPATDLLDWAPRFTFFNSGPSRVCAPMTIRVRDAEGNPVVSAMVYSRRGDRWLKQGTTNMSGEIEVVGVHEFDGIYAWGSNVDGWVTDTSQSPPTNFWGSFEGLTRIETAHCR